MISTYLLLSSTLNCKCNSTRWNDQMILRICQLICITVLSISIFLFVFLYCVVRYGDWWVAQAKYIVLVVVCHDPKTTDLSKWVSIFFSHCRCLLLHLLCWFSPLIYRWLFKCSWHEFALKSPAECSYDAPGSDFVLKPPTVLFTDGFIVIVAKIYE